MVGLQWDHWRTQTMTMFMVLLGSYAGIFHTAIAQHPAQLDGRLGGGYATFVARFGEPTEVNPSIGPVFAVDGYGLVAVQFSRLAGPASDDSPALLITIQADRPTDVPATTPDVGDWSVDELLERVLELVPEDAEIGEPVAGVGGGLTLPCQSTSLLDAFGVSGHCTIQAIQTDPGHISFATISLAGEIDPVEIDAAEDECEGVIAWSQEVGERLLEGQTLLDSLAVVDETASDVQATLTGLEAAFDGLASEQRTAAAPVIAATTNFYLISAFKLYADAIADATVGIAEDDATAIEAALVGIDQATVRIERATRELELVIAECDLDVASPIAGS